MEPCARKYCRICKEIIKWHIIECLHKIYYQLVFHVLYTRDASFDPNQHQQSGHLNIRGKGIETKMRLDRTLQFGFEKLYRIFHTIVNIFMILNKIIDLQNTALKASIKLN